LGGVDREIGGGYLQKTNWNHVKKGDQLPKKRIEQEKKPKEEIPKKKKRSITFEKSWHFR